MMQGYNEIRFKNYPEEEYILTMPNFYARGILFGRMYMELGDTVQIRCPANDLICEIEFKVKVIICVRIYEFRASLRELTIKLLVKLKWNLREKYYTRSVASGLMSCI